MALRVYIERQRDFGREMHIALIESTVVDGRVAEYVLVPHRVVPGEPFPVNSVRYIDLQFDRTELQEGTRIPDDAFIRLSELIGEQILQALVVELARLGYITHDPHGTRLAESREHLVTLRTENDRKAAQIEKLIGALVGVTERNV